jgi:hypothetical protein
MSNRSSEEPVKKMERETRFELATSTLARLHSTTELFPLAQPNWKGREYNGSPTQCQQKNLSSFPFRYSMRQRFSNNFF